MACTWSCCGAERVAKLQLGGRFGRVTERCGPLPTRLPEIWASSTEQHGAGRLETPLPVTLGASAAEGVTPEVVPEARLAVREARRAPQVAAWALRSAW